MQLKELAAQYRATGCALRARAAELRLELAAMPRSGRARRELSERIARLEEMAGETLYTAGYLAHYYDPDSRAPRAECGYTAMKRRKCAECACPARSHGRICQRACRRKPKNSPDTFRFPVRRGCPASAAASAPPHPIGAPHCLRAPNRRPCGFWTDALREYAPRTRRPADSPFETRENHTGICSAAPAYPSRVPLLVYR